MHQISATNVSQNSSKVVCTGFTETLQVLSSEDRESLVCESCGQGIACLIDNKLIISKENRPTFVYNGLSATLQANEPLNYMLYSVQPLLEQGDEDLEMLN